MKSSQKQISLLVQLIDKWVNLILIIKSLCCNLTNLTVWWECNLFRRYSVINQKIGQTSIQWCQFCCEIQQLFRPKNPKQTIQTFFSPFFQFIWFVFVLVASFCPFVSYFTSFHSYMCWYPYKCPPRFTKKPISWLGYTSVHFVPLCLIYFTLGR